SDRRLRTAWLGQAGECAGDLLAALESGRAILRGRAPDDLHDRRWNRSRRPRPVENLRMQYRRQLTGERGLAVQQLVKDHAERVDVGARVDGLALHLLWPHVRRRADHAACRGQALLVVDELGDSEVEDLRLASVGDEDVVGLDVAVDDAEVVRDADR